MTVTDNVGTDGVDTLLNIQLLQFTDVTINSPVTSACTIVPNVLNNQTLAQATATLAAAGFGVASASANSATVPAGIVMSQTPAAGTVATSGSTVGIVVSVGPVLVQVPNVVGSTLAAATTSLQGLGFVVTSTTVANAAPAGQRAHPESGQRRQQGSGIDRRADRLGGADVGGPGRCVRVRSRRRVRRATSVGQPEDDVTGGAGATAPTRVALESSAGRSGSTVRDNISVIDGAAGTKLDLTTGMTG